MIGLSSFASRLGLSLERGAGVQSSQIGKKIVGVSPAAHPRRLVVCNIRTCDSPPVESVGAAVPRCGKIVRVGPQELLRPLWLAILGVSQGSFLPSRSGTEGVQCEVLGSNKFSGRFTKQCVGVSGLV